MSKVFDRLDRSKLFHHIYKMGIQGNAFNLIRVLYHKVDNIVIFGSFKSEVLEVSSGVNRDAYYKLAYSIW